MWNKVRDNLIEQRESLNDSKGWDLFFYSFIVIFLCFNLLKTFVFCSIIVNGTSMDNTLSNGDLLVVNKLDKVDNGDIIVFHAGTVDKNGNIEYKYDANNQPILYIKRVIACGGEKVFWKDGIVYREYFDGEKYVKVQLDEPYAKGKTYSSIMVQNNAVGTAVPEGYYFVMGDNRLVSNDSRGTIGLVDKRLVMGVVPDTVVQKKDTFLKVFYKIF